MAFLENGNTVISDTRDITAQYAVLTANNRVYVGASPNIPTSSTLGTVAMFFSGGLDPGTPSGINFAIKKLPYASDTSPSFTSVGTITQNPAVSYHFSPGTSGPTSGYHVTSGPFAEMTINKFPFSAPFAGSTTAVGYFSVGKGRHGSSQSVTTGYFIGGPNPAVPSSLSSSIQKFPFASEGNISAGVASISITMRDFSTQQSDTHGYTTGGYSSGRYLRHIDKYPFSSDNNAVTVGALNYPASAGREHNGLSSTTDGYCVSGSASGTINKFPFATDNFIASAPGTISTPPPSGSYARYGGCSSSTVAGYIAGAAVGSSPGFAWAGVHKLPFAADTSTSVLTATIVCRAGAGHQSRV